jgi:stage III sporulation protein AE
MRKITKGIFIAGVLFAAFCLPSYAVGTGEDYWQDFIELAPEGTYENMDEALTGVGIKSLLSEILGTFSDASGEAFSFFALLLGVSVLLSVAESCTPFENPALSKHTSAAVSIITAVLIFGRIGGACFSVRESLDSLSALFSGLIPILTGILTAGGNINSAASQALNMNITLGAVSYVSASLLIPLVFSLFALALVSGMGGGTVSGVAKNIKGLFNWILGIGTTVLLAAVSMQSIIAGAQDTAYLRAAKYAASGMIPLVGSTVSGALGTLAGGLSYVKSAVGVSAVMMIVTLALAPLVTLLLYRLAFSLSISFLEFMDAKGGVRSFSAFRSALDALIAVYSLSAVVYVSEIVVFMKSGVSVFG